LLSSGTRAFAPPAVLFNLAARHPPIRNGNSLTSEIMQQEDLYSAMEIATLIALIGFIALIGVGKFGPFFG
jgi:hypothetical protein